MWRSTASRFVEGLRGMPGFKEVVEEAKKQAAAKAKK